MILRILSTWSILPGIDYSGRLPFKRTPVPERQNFRRSLPMRGWTLLTWVTIALLAAACGPHRVSGTAPVHAPAAVTATVRESLPDDYLRVSFLSPGVKVTSLSRPGALRAFATATPLF